MMKKKILNSFLFIVLCSAPLLVQAQTTYNINPEIVSGQVYHNDGIISDIGDVPTNNPYVNGHSVDGTTVLKLGKSDSNGDSFVTNGVIPFKLPVRPTGKLVVSANLKVNIAYLRHWIDANVDLYGLPYNASATINASDYYDGTYSDPTGTVTAIQSGFIVRDTGDTEPLGTLVLADREVNSNASGDAALLAYINAQYDAGAVAGDYVFLRMSINVSSASVPNGLLGGHYYGISDGRTANAPELLLEIQDADPVAAATADFTVTTPAEDGYVSDPGVIMANNPFLTGAAKLGKSAVDGSANLTTVILPFALPARPAGETVDFANLNVYVSFGRQFVNANVDLHGLTFKQSIANGGTGSAISSADHFGGAYPDATAGVTAIEDDYFTKNVPLNNLDTPRWEETTAEANLIAYLNAQYDAGAVAGDWVFLRLNMDNAAMTGSQYFNIEGGDSANPAALEIGFTSSPVTNTWNGGSTDWATPGNWSEGSVPTATENVVIPDLANDPIIGATTGAVANDITTNDVLTIASGGSLIISGTSTGNITYNRTLTNGSQWYFMSSPVINETYDATWVTTNSILSGQNNNRGISTYDNTSLDTDSGAGDTATGNWRYLQSDDSNSGTFNVGQGYGVIRDGSGTVSFTGTGIHNTSQTTGITQGVVNNFNLVGNPFTSYLNLGDFFTDNPITTVLVASEAYFWNGSTYDTRTSALNASYEIAPGQGFFIEAAADVNLTFDITDVSHQGTDTFQKSSRPEVHLFLSDGKNSRYANMYYISGATKGFDNGYDGKLFGGIEHSFALYSHLVSDSKGKNYQLQSLPDSNYENMIVPIGIKADAGKEITFSAKALNLPSGIKVFLEDKFSNTFTRLDNANNNYKITLTEKENGIGRFYLHTKSSALNISNFQLNDISIYKTNNSTLRIVGLPSGTASVKLFNILGKQIMSSSFKTTGVQDISLPKLETGIYLVQLETLTGKLNKKIILE